ncbi:MAG: hypothetical protein MZW92_14925 [Comamonadaceae bacterium]|nr:hypothetical protein [Comamonadaceae bacterium]
MPPPTRAIGEHGLRDPARPGAAARPRVNVMTHCNAGWLATVAHGTALAPVYAAHAAGMRDPRLRERDAAAQPGPAHRLGTAAAAACRTR